MNHYFRGIESLWLVDLDGTRTLNRSGVRVTAVASDSYIRYTPSDNHIRDAFSPG